MYVNAIKQVLQSRGIKAGIKNGYINYAVERRESKEKDELMRYVKFAPRVPNNIVYVSLCKCTCEYVRYTWRGSN